MNIKVNGDFKLDSFIQDKSLSDFGEEEEYQEICRRDIFDKYKKGVGKKTDDNR
jgi:hypothetical protein